MSDTYYLDGLLLLIGAALAHLAHLYIFSIPVGIFALIRLGLSLKKEMGL